MVRAEADISGRNCPYCRFPIKEGTEVTVCPTCGAPHHTECWNDNQGCAITACASGPATVPTTPPTATSTQAVPPAAVVPRQPRVGPARAPYTPPGRPPRDRARNGALFASLVAILVLGAALAFVIGKGSGHTTTTELVKTEAASHGAGRTTSTTTPKEPSTTTSSLDPGSSTPSLTSYTGSNFSMMIPSGWVQDVHEKQLGEEAESRWSNPSNSSEYILLDVHTPAHVTMREGAEPVRDQLAKQPGYTQIYYGPGSLSRHPESWMWIFEIEGAERIDYFFETCSNTMGVLGSAPPSRFNELRGTYTEVANSFRSECE
jgi:Prokaryotic RING finger family 1